jgi:hypothetical protein
MFLLRSLDVGDIQHLIREFSRIDADGSGSLSRRELFIFFKKGLCYDITPKELDDLFSAIDADGDGSISLREFLCAVNPAKAATALSTLSLHNNTNKHPRGALGDDQKGAAMNLAAHTARHDGLDADRAELLQRRLADVYQGSGVFESEMTNDPHHVLPPPLPLSSISPTE